MCIANAAEVYQSLLVDVLGTLLRILMREDRVALVMWLQWIMASLSCEPRLLCWCKAMDVDCCIVGSFSNSACRSMPVLHRASGLILLSLSDKKTGMRTVEHFSLMSQTLLVAGDPAWRSRQGSLGHLLPSKLTLWLNFSLPLPHTNSFSSLQCVNPLILVSHFSNAFDHSSVLQTFFSLSVATL